MPSCAVSGDLERHPPVVLLIRCTVVPAPVLAGSPEQAIPLFEQTLTDCRRLLGGEHPLSRTVATNLQRARTMTNRPLRRR
jgi:hypothetical protein